MFFSLAFCIQVAKPTFLEQLDHGFQPQFENHICSLSSYSSKEIQI